MSNLYFTSDEHYGHASRRDTGAGGVIKLCKRPFDSLEDMKRCIIERHNAVIPRGRGTLVVHVGDWFWHSVHIEEATAIIDQLNGRQGFQFGNHDELMVKYGKFLLDTKRVEFIIGKNQAGGCELYHHDKKLLSVDHFARRVWQGSHRGHWHLYGHSHNGLPGLGKSLDIGVDGHNFYPWSLEEIEQVMDSRSPHHTIDNTGQPDEKDNVNEGVHYPGGDFETGFKA